MLRIEHLSKAYGEKKAVDDLNQHIAPGEIFGYLIKKPKQLFLKTGVGMILGGAWSNVWDRITRKYVVDYFSFHTKCRKLERVVFNLADMFIFLGGFLVIFWNMLRKS